MVKRRPGRTRRAGYRFIVSWPAAERVGSKRENRVWPNRQRNRRQWGNFCAGKTAPTRAANCWGEPAAPSRLAARINAAPRARLSCFAQSEAGIARPDRDDTCCVADLAVTCAPLQPGQSLMTNPLLIVEILSSGRVAHDRHTRVPDYRRIASVQEILLVDSERIFAKVLRRNGKRWITEIIQGRDAVLSLASVALTTAMSDLCDGIPIAEAFRRPGAG